MKKSIIFLMLTIFLVVSCSSSKKAENDADILPDEDVINDEEAVEPDEDKTDNDEDELEDIDPCDPNPCIGIENSTEECTADADQYSCACVDNYFWDGKKCVNPCKGIDCTKFEHTIGECRSSDAFAYKCDCDEGFWWWKDKGCIAPKHTAANVCTGQNKCYDNEKEIDFPAEGEEFFGQDAQYAKLGYCIPQSFSIDNSVEDEPVVVDNNLGLMWQRKIPPLEERYIEDVLQYCEDLVYGGYSDWRLPTLEDFMSIADYGKYDPAVNTEYFPDTGLFWTATKYKLINGWPEGNYAEHHTIFDFEESSSYQEVTCRGLAGLSPDYEPFSFNIRCVRGGTAKTSGYILPGTLWENTIWSDNNLIIMKKPDTDLTWAEALKYCSELDYAGISDWRLPNVKELVLSRWGSSDFSLWENALTSTTKPADPAFNFSNLNYRLASYNYSAYFYSKKEKVKSALVCVANDPCGKGTFWNGVKCVKNPCDPNPCESEDDLNSTCKIIDENSYTCGCSRCMDTYKEHSTGKCHDDIINGFYCSCEKGYYWSPWAGEGCVKD